jgi:hypothetical protein
MSVNVQLSQIVVDGTEAGNLSTEDHDNSSNVSALGNSTPTLSTPLPSELKRTTQQPTSNRTEDSSPCIQATPIFPDVEDAMSSFFTTEPKTAPASPESITSIQTAAISSAVTTDDSTVASFAEEHGTRQYAPSHTERPSLIKLWNTINHADDFRPHLIVGQHLNDPNIPSGFENLGRDPDSDSDDDEGSAHAFRNKESFTESLVEQLTSIAAEANHSTSDDAVDHSSACADVVTLTQFPSDSPSLLTSDDSRPSPEPASDQQLNDSIEASSSVELNDHPDIQTPASESTSSECEPSESIPPESTPSECRSSYDRTAYTASENSQDEMTSAEEIIAHWRSIDLSSLVSSFEEYYNVYTCKLESTT